MSTHRKRRCNNKINDYFLAIISTYINKRGFLWKVLQVYRIFFYLWFLLTAYTNDIMRYGNSTASFTAILSYFMHIELLRRMQRLLFIIIMKYSADHVHSDDEATVGLFFKHCYHIIFFIVAVIHCTHHFYITMCALCMCGCASSTAVNHAIPMITFLFYLFVMIQCSGWHITFRWLYTMHHLASPLNAIEPRSHLCIYIYSVSSASDHSLYPASHAILLKKKLFIVELVLQ